tara:strand:- start:3598 stop:3999 length:402 start_codon:yes stop_codon:yes gene_type:complete
MPKGVGYGKARLRKEFKANKRTIRKFHSGTMKILSKKGFAGVGDSPKLDQAIADRNRTETKMQSMQQRKGNRFSINAKKLERLDAKKMRSAAKKMKTVGKVVKTGFRLTPVGVAMSLFQPKAVASGTLRKRRK